MLRYADSSRSGSESTQPVTINGNTQTFLTSHKFVVCHYLSGRLDQQCTLRQWNAVHKLTLASFKIDFNTTVFPPITRFAKSSFKILSLILLVCGYSMKYQCGHVTPYIIRICTDTKLAAMYSQNGWNWNSSLTYTMIWTGTTLFVHFWFLTVIQIN